MTPEDFFKITEECGFPDSTSPDEIGEAVGEFLCHRSNSFILDFENTRLEILASLHTPDLVKIAFMLQGHVSKESFEDFRNYLIMLGRAPVRVALTTPDDLAKSIKVEDPLEELDGSALLYSARSAWIGDEAEFDAGIKHPQEPALPTSWPDPMDLEQEFPKLFRKYCGY
ncbi:MAG: DUF4240 domain-containing protein [Planctomycetota bacterium]|nr:DUF4240 domain-containing protein [Planctomycetota bacterium]